MSKNAKVSLWPPLRRAGTNIYQRIESDKCILNVDDNYNSANLTSPLTVSDDFSSNDTLNQWSLSFATGSSSMAFATGKMTITRNTADAYDSMWSNRNSMGRNIMIATDYYSTTASAGAFVRATDKDNGILVLVQTNGTFVIYTVAAGVATSRATTTVPSYSSAKTYRLVVKVYDDNVSAYVKNDSGYVASTLHYCNAIVGAYTGTINGIGTGASGTSVTYDNYKSRIMQSCTNIIALGDSNTIGQYIADRCPTEKTFTNLLANEYLEDDFVIYNGGVSSRQTTAVNAALAAELYPYFVDRARNAVILLVGMGDFTIGGKTAAAAWADMQTLCTNIMNNGWELLVLTYFPKEDDTTNNEKCRDFNDYIRKGADAIGFRVMDTWDMFIDKSNDLDADPQYYYPGSATPTHINETGHDMVFDKLKTYFYPAPTQPLVLAEQVWPIKRVEICDHDKTSLIRLYHDNSNAYLSTSTGAMLFDAATDNYTFGGISKISVSSLATGGGVSIFDVKAVNENALGFRMIPSTASTGFSVYGENYMSFFELHADSTSLDRYVVGMPETAASGIVTISRASAPRPFIWAFATGSTSKKENLRLARYGQLTLTTTAPASNLTASTENISFNANTSATKTWAAGALTTQRENVFQAPTYAFASASTVTTAATLAITGAPTAGTNATITNPYALWVQAGNSAFAGNVIVSSNTYIGSYNPFGVASQSSVLSTSGDTLQLSGADADGASSIGAIIGNSVSQVTSGAKLVSFMNATVEEAYINKDGLGYFGGGVTLPETGTATAGDTEYDSTNLIISGSAWDTNDSVARTTSWKIYGDAKSTTTPYANFYIEHDSGAGAGYVTKLYYDHSGECWFANGASGASYGGGFGFSEGAAKRFYFYPNFSTDEILMATSTSVGNQIVLTTTGALSQDHDHADGTNPYLYIHDATAPNTTNNYWGGLYHNGATGGFVILSGAETGAGTSPGTIDNYIMISPRGSEACRFTGTGYVQPASRVLGKQGADVASGNDITLGGGNYFDITGTTEVQRILGTGWTAGSIITLQFDGSVTVKHGTAAGSSYYGFQLAGAADFSATAGDTLVLIFDGAWFREIARTVI